VLVLCCGDIFQFCTQVQGADGLLQLLTVDVLLVFFSLDFTCLAVVFNLLYDEEHVEDLGYLLSELYVL
jgi:hypothetical protein